MMHGTTNIKFKRRFVRLIKTGFRTFSTVPHGNSITKFQCKSAEREYFQPTIWNQVLHQDSNDNGDKIVNFAIPKNLIVKNTMFPHRNILK